MRENLQRGRKALTAWKVWSCTRASPPGPAGAGCQSRHGVDETTSELAAKKIGHSEVGAPTGESTVTICGGAAAIVPLWAIEDGRRAKRTGPESGRKNPCSRLHARYRGTRCGGADDALALFQSYRYVRAWLALRAPARYALWRRAPLQGPPPWPPSVSTSAARRPIALRREPTFLRP